MNRRPHAPQTCTLTNCATARFDVTPISPVRRCCQAPSLRQLRQSQTFEIPQSLILPSIVPEDRKPGRRYPPGASLAGNAIRQPRSRGGFVGHDFNSSSLRIGENAERTHAIARVKAEVRAGPQPELLSAGHNVRPMHHAVQKVYAGIGVLIAVTLSSSRSILRNPWPRRAYSTARWQPAPCRQGFFSMEIALKRVCRWKGSKNRLGFAYRLAPGLKITTPVCVETLEIRTRFGLRW